MSILRQNPVIERPAAGHAPRSGQLPVLQHALGNWPMPAARVVLVTHLLDTAVPYVRALADCTELEEVVPVPYSAQPEALSLLDEFPIRMPGSIEEVGEYATAAVRRGAARGGAPMVLQEVGGYCSDAVQSLGRIPRFRGIVEDTKQGQWRYERNMPLPVPVFTIADSPLKALESVQVGRSIAYSAERLMRSRFYRLLSECRVLVLGYGEIGTALAEHLRRSAVEVAVYDPSEVRMSAAVVHGFRVGAREDLLPWADVIIGVSGHRSLTADDLPLLRNGIVLLSGSSKQVEFDVAGLCQWATSTAELDEVLELRADGRAVYLLNRGKPVNFLEQSILGSVLDLVYTELYLCTRELARRKWEPGLHRLEPDMQQELARIWRKEYGKQ